MVRSMWLFKHKFHADGTLSLYKARLVANGSSQQLSVDFDETFIMAVKPTTIRTVLSLALSSSSFVLLQQIMASLHNEFDMTDLGELNYFLGISATRYPTDLSYVVQQICLYMHDPREPHFAALKRILRYVRGTVDFGLQLYFFATTSLVGYTDADWAGCPSIRRSTLGYCVFLGDNILSWSSKRQHTLSCFSVKAEYHGVTNVVAETSWLRNLLRELHSPISTATLVYCDNVSVVYMSANPI
nr:ribonuclease H-like domain-containing protein [Tanacetum cinerariifolium]